MIYLDNAAATKTDEAVLEAMLPFFREAYGNPSSIHRAGSAAREAVAEARRQCAALIGAREDEIFFTSGGTEADNWAVKAVFEALSGKGRHIITSSVEHPAVLRTCEYLERFCGARITYLKPDRAGRIRTEDLEKAVCPDTVLITVMTANNEIGTIQDVRRIGGIARKNGILFHTDAVQAAGQIPIDVEEMKIDLLSVSGHKFYGPKGTGFLYIRRSVPVRALLHGGPQERHRRAGTENVPGIVGLGTAARLARENLEERIAKETFLRDRLIRLLSAKIPLLALNGPSGEELSDRLPNNVNVSIPYTDSETVLIRLDMEGICASGGSACATGSSEPSHVLRAVGCTEEEARSALRFSLSKDTTEEELEETAEKLAGIVRHLRSFSPGYAAGEKDGCPETGSDGR